MINLIKKAKDVESFATNLILMKKVIYIIAKLDYKFTKMSKFMF